MFIWHLIVWLDDKTNSWRASAALYNCSHDSEWYLRWMTTVPEVAPSRPADGEGQDRGAMTMKSRVFGLVAENMTKWGRKLEERVQDYWNGRADKKVYTITVYETREPEVET